jgi:hypothetical protein
MTNNIWQKNNKNEQMKACSAFLLAATLVTGYNGSIGFIT